ncbi:MAG: hypothetical protein MI919_23525 [Holophagales bacterium]|nr:hypothetical protein [Holophagales bacterium]
MDLRAKREELRRRTVLGGGPHQVPGERVDGSRWQPGAVWMAEGGEDGIEWLVAAESPRPSHWICVPLDVAPFLSAEDLDLSGLTGEPLKARCGQAIDIPAPPDDSARVHWVLPAEGVARVRERVEEYAGREHDDERQESAAREGPAAEADGEWLARVHAEGLRLKATWAGSSAVEPDRREIGGGDRAGSGNGARERDDGVGGELLRGRFPWREVTAWVLAAGFAAWAVGVSVELRRMGHLAASIILGVC